MNNLKEYRLKDIVEGIYDGPHATPAKAEEGGIFLGIKNITEEGRIDLKDPYFISEKDLSKWTRRITPKYGDLVFSYEATLHRYALIPKEFYGCLGRRMALVRPKREVLDVKFLFYLFLSPSWRSFIEANQVSGSTVDRISLVKFPSYRIQLPPLPTQQRIASILSAYDDLIEVNNQRIKLLEETARELYKEWFVRMRFPGWKETKFVKGVPEGWAVKKIGEVCKVARGSSPRPIVDTRFFEKGTIPWVKIADATASGKFLFETKEYVNEFGASFSRLLEPGSLIIATSGTLGFCIFLAIEACIHDGWLYTYDYKYSISPEFLFYVVNERTEYFNNLSYGAAIQNINTEILRKAPFILPSKQVLEKFQSIIVLINEQQKNLQLQNTQLRQIRDRLLPRLISGKLSIKEP